MKIELTREQYRELKKKDRNGLTKFIENIYWEGFKAARKSPEKATPEAINEIIKKTKGVGEAKRKAIMEEVTKLFE